VEDQLHIPRGTLVVIGDGAKALFLRNTGSAHNIDLHVERVLEHENPPTREQGTDQPGRVTSRVAIQRSAMEETDWHRLGEKRFAVEIADVLGRLANDDPRQKFILVAPPAALGDLRKALEKSVADRVLAELPKDLTSHPLPEIRKLLVRGDLTR
jgi:protein required for attachment to host cells